MISRRNVEHATALLGTCCVVACGSSSDPVDPTVTAPKLADGGSAGYVDDSGHPKPGPQPGGKDGGSPGAGDGGGCPAVDGAWTGPAAGALKGTIAASMDGSASFKLTPSGSTTYQLADGSAFQFTVHSAVFGNVGFTQPLRGTVECGVVKATLGSTIGGTSFTGTATCTFVSSGCEGTWQGATSDSSTTGSGTFSLKR
jgi:hypothetical protein